MRGGSNFDLEDEGRKECNKWAITVVRSVTGKSKPIYYRKEYT